MNLEHKIMEKKVDMETRNAAKFYQMCCFLA